ncbi:MAG: hypothetical protein HQK82_11165 [Desulfovibrionaceae bacterium]|nr:hypothetical protein [Desulfovibrionaceae bacterium]
MTGNRLTKQSVENLKIAASAVLEAADGGGYVVRLVGGGGRIAYLNGSEDIQVYETTDLARRALRRLRPDLPITVAPSIGQPTAAELQTAIETAIGELDELRHNVEALLLIAGLNKGHQRVIAGLADQAGAIRHGLKTAHGSF